MLFYDQNDFVCAYVRNQGMVCVDAGSPYFAEHPPAHTPLTTCDESAPYTNPYGDVLLVHSHLPHDMCYNTVLQELVDEDWPNMFTVEDGEPNPYTEMLHGDVDVELLIRSDAWCRVKDKTHDGAPVRLTYESKTKTIRVYDPGDSSDEPVHLFDMRKDEFLDTFEVRCIDR